MKPELYCTTCMRYRTAANFSDWFDAGSKTARRCNCCLASTKDPKSEAFAERLKAKAMMLEESQSKLTPVQLNYSGSDRAKKALNIRRNIEDIKQAKALGITPEQLRGEA